ncbi:MAG: serine/threonine-protein kinase [Myxococcota bacterium]
MGAEGAERGSLWSSRDVAATRELASSPTRPELGLPDRPDIDDACDAVDPVDPVVLADDRYEILALLGEGGMGEVYRARDRKLGREVALKRLKPSVLDQRARARLSREAQALAQLSHPNVVEVYGLETAGDFVLVMELVEGSTLSGWMAQGPHPWPEALAVLLPAGRGLAAAHQAGLVHRDFKPANVMRSAEADTDGGRVRVMDFGLARPPGASLEEERSEPSEAAVAAQPSSGAWDEALTATGIVVGTPAYMAPEQFLDERADGRADQYAFCVTLWQALCGARPFQGSYTELGQAKLRGPPPWPPHVDAPRPLVEALRRGLAADPRDRWPSMEALLDRLDAVAAPRSRLAWGGAWGGAVAVAALGTVLLGVWGQGRSPASSPECEEPVAVRDHLWSDEHRHAIATALQETEAPQSAEIWSRMRPALDDYAERWAERWGRARHEACERQGAGPQGEAANARVRCLEDRRRRFEARIEALRGVSREHMAEIARTVESLPSLRACDDGTWQRAGLTPLEDPALARQVATLRSRLARAEALRDTARCSEAVVVLDEVRPQVDALGYPPLRAELRLGDGFAAECAGEYAASEQALREAYFVAIEQGYDRVAFEAALQLTHVAGVAMEQHDEGMQWVEHARAVLARTGNDADRVRLEERLGSLHHAAGRYEDAVEAYRKGLARLDAERDAGDPDDAEGSSPDMRRAVLLASTAASLRMLERFEEAQARLERSIALAREVAGDDDPFVIKATTNLANVLSSRGEVAQAERLQREVLVRAERIFGSEHPQTLKLVGNLGMSLSLLGQLEEAIAFHRRCLVGMEQVYGPEHPAVGIALNNLGIDQLVVGRVEEAIASHRRALEIRESVLGPEHAWTASSLTNLADALMVRGDHQSAAPHYARAQAIIEKVLGPDSLFMSYAVLGLGRAHVAAGRLEQALPLLERAVVLRTQNPTPPPEFFEAHFELARVLWSLDRDRDRALRLATEGLAAVEALGGEVRQRDEARAWLQARAR